MAGGGCKRPLRRLGERVDAAVRGDAEEFVGEAREVEGEAEFLAYGHEDVSHRDILVGVVEELDVEAFVNETEHLVSRGAVGLGAGRSAAEGIAELGAARVGDGGGAGGSGSGRARRFERGGEDTLFERDGLADGVHRAGEGEAGERDAGCGFGLAGLGLFEALGGDAGGSHAEFGHFAEHGAVACAAFGVGFRRFGAGVAWHSDD